MSNFICEHCGKEIIEGPGGEYVTGCEHYPLEKLCPRCGAADRAISELTNGKQEGFVEMSPGLKALVEPIVQTKPPWWGPQ